MNDDTTMMPIAMDAAGAYGAPAASDAQSVIEPLPYQRAFLADDARFVLLLWSRQTGKSFAFALKVNDDVLAAEAQGRRTQWTLVAASKPRARELALKVRDIGRAACMARRLLQGPQLADLEDSQYELIYPGGSRVIVAAAGSAAGYTGNLGFDEFDLVQRQEEVWGDAFPIASRHNYKVIVMTTPRGRRKAYQLYRDSEQPEGIWSVHRLTIHEAVAQGCPQDPETLRRAIKSEQLWRQEYLCEFVDEAAVWLSWALITSCVDDRCTLAPRASENPVFAGWDIARYNHLSVLWLLERVGRTLVTCGVVAMHGMEFEAQLELVERTLRSYPGFTRLCIDQTGMGEMPTEVAQKRLGRYRVEGIKFNTIKPALAGAIRHAMEERLLLIPDDEEVFADLNCVQQTISAANKPRFEGESGGSHADRFWAACLAVHAGQPSERPFVFTSEGPA